MTPLVFPCGEGPAGPVRDASDRRVSEPGRAQSDSSRAITSGNAQEGWQNTELKTRSNLFLTVLKSMYVDVSHYLAEFKHCFVKEPSLSNSYGFHIGGPVHRKSLRDFSALLCSLAMMLQYLLRPHCSIRNLQRINGISYPMPFLP